MGQVVYLLLLGKTFSVKLTKKFLFSFEHANATNTSAMADAYINQNPEKESEYKGNIKENDYR